MSSRRCQQDTSVTLSQSLRSVRRDQDLSQQRPSYSNLQRHPCAVCILKYPTRHTWVKCDVCGAFAHTRCAGFPSRREADRSSWKCPRAGVASLPPPLWPPNLQLPTWTRCRIFQLSLPRHRPPPRHSTAVNQPHRCHPLHLRHASAELARAPLLHASCHREWIPPLPPPSTLGSLSHRRSPAMPTKSSAPPPFSHRTRME